MLYSGNETMAKKSLMQALQYDPDYQPAKLAIKAIKKVAEQKELASDIFKKGDYEKAAIAFQQCAEIDDLNLAYNATALLNKAICETKLNKNDEALRSLNQAIRMNPNYAKALVKRGEVNMVLKEYEEAVRDFNKASQLDSTGFGV